ncbi:TLC domain-containing protein At5g14285-like [Magnolia sinica]|uniref:TLC domain-containing protein At5g14285-like n=1 Tax=Magnolia sinica TaxID=86752 RepID=UPI0026597385|nr:TLC domain-containing protein At5g14285-like [Magnolia sinica]
MENSILTSISYIPLFSSFFILIYFLAYFGIFQHWSPKQRTEASSCFMSLTHGTPAVLMAAFAIVSQAHHSFASPNTNFQNLVLDFSIAYFLVDLLHYFIFFPDDYLYIAHHLATLFVFVTCRYLVFHGAFSILILLALAEVTSACQNTWSLANIQRVDVPAAARLYEFLSPPFYTLMRVFAGPVFTYKMGVFYLSGEADNVIPGWVSISWMVVIVAAISVSSMWILNNWMELYKERIRRSEKKTR